MISPFKFFSIYQPVKLHFYTKYDYVKYKGKHSSLNKDRFEKRKDFTIFAALASKINSPTEALWFSISNFLIDKNWIYGSFEYHKNIYLEKQKFFSSFSKNVQADLMVIEQVKKEKGITLDNFFTTTQSGNFPPLLQLYINNVISIETVVMLDIEFGFLEKWSIEFSNDPYLVETVNKICKYKPFIILYRNGQKKS